MKQTIKIFSLILAMVSVFYWLQSCDGTNFSNGSSVEEEEPVDTEEQNAVEEEKPQEEAKTLLTDEQRMEEFKNMTAADIKGKKVRVCMSYVGTHHLHCNLTSYNIYFNGEKSSTVLDLSNDSTRSVKLISGKTLQIGKYYVSKSNQSIDLEAFDEEMKSFIMSHRAKNHVPGVIFKTQWNKDGQINIRSECSLPSCNHGMNGTVSISMIGEVIFSDGSKKYISSPLQAPGASKGTSELPYDFSTFSLEENTPEFDDYCSIVIKNNDKADKE